MTSDSENTPRLEDLPTEQPPVELSPPGELNIPAPGPDQPTRASRKKSFFKSLQRKQVLALLCALALFDLAFWAFAVRPLADQEQRQVERIANLTRQIA